MKHIALDVPIAPVQAAPFLDMPSLLFKAHLLTSKRISDFFFFIILSYKCKVKNLNVLVMIGRVWNFHSKIHPINFSEPVCG